MNKITEVNKLKVGSVYLFLRNCHSEKLLNVLLVQVEKILIDTVQLRRLDTRSLDSTCSSFLNEEYKDSTKDELYLIGEVI
jgi:hypothetical protein